MAETKQEAARRIEKSKALAFELRQIIQADRMALDILNNAEHTRRDIEQKTKAEADEILLDAQVKKQEVTKQVIEEQEARLEQRKNEARATYAGQKEHLEKHMAANKDKWVGEITRAILES